MEIYVSGCHGKCQGCHNAELWDFNQGTDYKKWLPKLESRIKSGLVDQVWLLGGDPLDQNPDDLFHLIKFLKSFPNLILWLWTRYSPEKVNPKILNEFHYLKTGEFIINDTAYIDKLTGIKLASSNQKILKLS